MPKIPLGNPLDAIHGAFKSGKILKADFETFERVYDPVTNNVTEAMDALREGAKVKKYQAALAAEKFDGLSARMDDMESGSKFLSNTISPAFKSDSSEINLDMRQQSLESLATKDMGELDEALSTRLTRLLGYDQEAQDNFVLGMFEPDNAAVTPKSKRMAASAKEAMDIIFEIRNKAGGEMKKLDQWGMPQSHDTIKMMDLPKELRAKKDKSIEGKKNQTKTRVQADYETAKSRWIEFTIAKLDYQRMGMKNASDASKREMLEEVFNTIASGGTNKVGDADLTGFTMAPKTANKRLEHREIHFRGAANWIDYQKQYGESDVYKTIKDYIQGMSREAAAMQIFGPNPEAMFTKLMQKAKNDGKETGFTGHLQGMFDVSTGKTDTNVAATGKEKGMASFFGGFRSMGVASDLGGAIWSSMTDPVISAVTAGHMGMNPLGLFISQMGTVARRIGAGMKVSEKEKFAQRMAIINESFMTSIRNNRFSEGGGSKTLQKLADGTLRVSGLTAWTNALRTTFGLEMNGFMADHIGKNLNDWTFGKQLQETYGLTQADWNKLTPDHLTSFENGSFLDPGKIYETDPALSMRLTDIINQETHYAVIMPDSKIRSLTTGFGSAKGSVGGELARTSTMYKSFPMALLSVHVGRMLGMKTVQGKLAYGGAMFMGLTTVAMGIVQIKDAMKGKEPMPTDNAEQWELLMKRAVLQGGGLGLFGDLFFSDATRYGGGMVSSVVGKMAQPLEDIDTIKKIYQGGSKNVAGDVWKRASNYIPGRNLWMTRLLFERSVTDNVQKMLDPDYNKKLRKHMKKMKKETGQGYWSKPGSF